MNSFYKLILILNGNILTIHYSSIYKVFIIFNYPQQQY